MTPYSLGELQYGAASGLDFRRREPMAAAPRRCLVLLHEMGTDESSLQELAAGMPADLLVLLLRAPLEIGAGQYAWFHTAFTDAGPRLEIEEAGASREMVSRFIAQMHNVAGIDARQTVVAGHGAGGIIAASVALMAPELVAGFAVFSGPVLPELVARTVSRERLASLRGFLAPGALPEPWLRRSEELLGGLGVDYRVHGGTPGDGIDAAMLEEFRGWLAALTGDA